MTNELIKKLAMIPIIAGGLWVTDYLKDYLNLSQKIKNLDFFQEHFIPVKVTETYNYETADTSLLSKISVKQNVYTHFVKQSELKKFLEETKKEKEGLFTLYENGNENTIPYKIKVKAEY